jgi:hypothetical protein
VRHHDVVAVGRRFRRELRRDHPGGAPAVLDEDGLAEVLGELLRDDAPDDVGAAAGREADEHTDRLGWVLLGGGGAARESGQQRDCIAGQSVHDFSSAAARVVMALYYLQE